jgi:hypothetical protein
VVETWFLAVSVVKGIMEPAHGGVQSDVKSGPFLYRL